MLQIHKKTFVLETVFNKFGGLTATLLKRHQHRCFPDKISCYSGKPLRTAVSKDYVIGVTDSD